MRELSRAASPLLMREFSAYRANRLSPNDFVACRLTAAPEKRLYDAFVNHVLSNFSDFFRAHIGLTRLLCDRVHLWIQHVQEVTSRICTDLPTLHKTLLHGGVHPTVPQIRVIHTLCGDSHNGGRSVTLLTLGEGRIVYKPRDLRIDAAFSEIASWVNERSGGRHIRTAHVIPRDGYGWAEYVEPTSHTAGQDYHWHYGYLLGLVHLLGGSDLHSANIIRIDSHPVPIDLETAMSSIVDLEEFYQYLAGVSNRLGASVLASGMLPLSDEAAARRDHHTSRQSGNSVIRYVNTDAMELHDIEQYRESFDTENLALPALDRADVDDIIRGFCDFYSFSLRHKQELASSNGPLRHFHDVPVRVIIRPTRIYHKVLRASLRPHCCVSGVARSIEVDRLAQAYLRLEDGARFSSILCAEHYAVCRGDIPYFWARANERTLHAGELECPDVVMISPWERLQESVRARSREDCHWQVQCIETAARLASGVSWDMPVVPEGHLSENQSQDYLEKECERQAFRILTASVSISVDEVSWLGAEYNLRRDGFNLTEADCISLYSGLPGIAVFLAQAHERLRHAELRTASEAAARRFVRAVSHVPTAVGPGGYVGMGGVLFALVTLGRTLNQSTYFETAATFAATIQLEWLRSQEEFDVFSGAAGLVLGLAALLDATGDSGVAETLRIVATYVADNATPVDRRAVHWGTRRRPPLCGFSHGNAGVAWALMRAWSLLGDDCLRTAALRGLEFERRQFDAKACNWPDYREGEDGQFKSTWCHGAPGIVMSRAAILSIEDLVEVRHDLEAGLPSVVGLRLQAHHLCCGQAGVAAILLSIGRLLSNTALVDAGHECLCRMINQSRAYGGYVMDSRLNPSVLVPGLMRGLSGVGWSLLRASSPSVGDVLLLA